MCYKDKHPEKDGLQAKWIPEDQVTLFLSVFSSQRRPHFQSYDYDC